MGWGVSPITLTCFSGSGALLFCPLAPGNHQNSSLVSPRLTDILKLKKVAMVPPTPLGSHLALFGLPFLDYLVSTARAFKEMI